MNRKNILLTGAFGYIGSHFIDNYHKLFNIKALDSKYFDEPKEIVSKTYLSKIKDIRDIDEDDIKDIDIVIHMSELSNDPMGEIDPKITQDININGTKKLVSILNKSKVSKLIYMSSCSVYGVDSTYPYEENSELNPLTEYAKAKVENENLLLNLDSNYQIKILRNATAFGFSPNHRIDLVVNDLVYSAIKNNKIELLSDGSPKRPIVHITDICKIIYLLITEEESKKLIFNVGSNEMNYSIKDIALKIAEMTKIENISFGDLGDDKRSYTVDFSYLKHVFPSFNFSFNLERGIEDLLFNYKNFELNKNSKRIQKLNYLIQENLIDKDFRYIN